MKIRRRDFVSGAIAGLTLGTPISGWTQDESEDLEDDMEAEILSSLEEELSELGGAGVVGLQAAATSESMISPEGEFVHHVPKLSAKLSASLSKRVRYWRLSKDDRVVYPSWTARDDNPDLFHTKEFGQPKSSKFRLDVPLLLKLAKANSLTVNKGQRFIFGLRGARLLSGRLDSKWSKSIDIEVVEPDHVRLKCLVGVCALDSRKPNTGFIRLFKASTVPQASNIYAAMYTSGWGCSLLPAGKYRLISGVHKSRSRWRQPAALRNMDKYICLRSPRDLEYNPTNIWDVWTYGAAHNVHAAGRRRRVPFFDSSGCQVIYGGYTRDRKRGLGAWRTFQQAAGLVDRRGRPQQYGRPYDYILLPALEAALAYHGDLSFDRSYQRLRPGSTGARVKQVSGATYQRLIKKQANE